jgi:hypothetical protein
VQIDPRGIFDLIVEVGFKENDSDLNKYRDTF